MEAYPDGVVVPLQTFDPAAIPDPQGKQVVFACRSGKRSVTASLAAQAAEMKIGFVNTERVFREEGVPLELAYVPLIESAFKPTALSRAKAKGVWQFMRPTAKENGLKHDWYIDERSDPEKATLAAAKYLKSLARTFKGDWHLALASYNGGPGRVQRAITQHGESCVLHAAPAEIAAAAERWSFRNAWIRSRASEKS